jgi:hypothetical protein
MADPALEVCTTQTSLKISQPSGLFTPESLKAIILSLLLYWGTSSLLLPVTTSDCQVYNLAPSERRRARGLLAGQRLEFDPPGDVPLDVRRGPLSVPENRVGIWYSQLLRFPRSPGDCFSACFP